MASNFMRRSSRAVASRFEQDLDRSGPSTVRDRHHGPLPVGEREPMGDHRGEVEAVPSEVEVVLERVLADTIDVFDAEGVRADDVQLLEVQGGPLEALGWLDTADDEGAAGLEETEAGLAGLGAPDRVGHHPRTALPPPPLAPRDERP